MNLLALIPARGGSKRVPKKNQRILGGKSLIAWSIDLARSLDAVTSVVVSTDDADIAEIAISAGATVDGLRPDYLSNDTASSLDVCLYELDRQEQKNGPVHGLLLLQPTSPFRHRKTVLEGIARFSDTGRAVVGLAPASAHPAWCFRMEKGQIVPFLSSTMPSRSQDMAPAFQVSGGLYIISPEQLRSERTFFPAGALGVVSTNEVEALDIDTEWDWCCAEHAINVGLIDLHVT